MPPNPKYLGLFQYQEQQRITFFNSKSNNKLKMGNSACCEKPIQPTQGSFDSKNKFKKAQAKGNMKKNNSNVPKNGFAYDYDDDKAPQFQSQGHDEEIDGNHRVRGTKVDIDILKNPLPPSPDGNYSSSPNGSNVNYHHDHVIDPKAKKHHDNQSFQMDFEQSHTSYERVNDRHNGGEIRLVGQVNSIPEVQIQMSMQIKPSLFNTRVLNAYNRMKPLNLGRIEGAEYRPCTRLPNDALYEGQWKNGTRHGLGKCLFADGSYYEGYLSENSADGFGRLIHADGDTYEGQWVQDKAQGKGWFLRENGARYEGDWENDQQHGKGVESWTDGSSYEGEYRKGLKHGMGFMKWKDGSTYEGEFHNNHIEGRGTYRWADGRFFVGEWKHNKIHGKGEFKWPDGRKYIGAYVNDKKEGYGEFYWPDGRVFKGQWLNGKQNGHGVMTDATGRRQEGVWADGKFQSSHHGSTLGASSHKSSIQSQQHHDHQHGAQNDHSHDHSHQQQH